MVGFTIADFGMTRFVGESIGGQPPRHPVEATESRVHEKARRRLYVEHEPGLIEGIGSGFHTITNCGPSSWTARNLSGKGTLAQVQR